MEKWALPEINPSLCNRCGICIKGCPTGAVEMGPLGPVIVRPADCTYCARCDAVCPQGAIMCFYEIVWETVDGAARRSDGPMNEPIARIRAHHAEILKELKEIPRVVANIQADSVHDAREALEGIVDFLEHDLTPHAEGEERFLYPAVDDLIKRHERATATMSLDHEAITEKIQTFRAQVQKLLELEEHQGGTEQAQDAMADLLETAHHLDAVISLHLNNEERVLLPLAEQYLPEAEAQTLLEQMHRGYH